MYHQREISCFRNFVRSRNTIYVPYQYHITVMWYSRVTLYTAGHLHTVVPHCSHSRTPIVHTAVPRENNEHGCVYLRCRAVCKLPGCVEGHPWYCPYVSRCSSDRSGLGYGNRFFHRGGLLQSHHHVGSLLHGPVIHQGATLGQMWSLVEHPRVSEADSRECFEWDAWIYRQHYS